ncbi:MAG: hypothetical protein PHG65_06370, partial [Kiritimatiellae bacterium]|nr:hypothetical protein [Kiritimatiellia bacterium]
RLGGRAFGLLAAFCLALHPIPIQMSRECYFYAPVMLGCVLMLWGLLILVDRLQNNQSPGLPFYALIYSGFILTTYLTSASWVFTLIVGIALYALLLPKTLRRVLPWRVVGILTGGFLLVSLPLLISEWGLKTALYQFAGEGAAHWGEVFGEKKLGVTVSDFLQVLQGFMLGRGPLRSLLNILLLAAAVYRVVSLWRKHTKWRVLMYCFAATFVLLFFVHARSVHLVASRHFAPLIPFFVLLVCLGLEWVAEVLQQRVAFLRGRSVPTRALAFLVLILAFGMPAVWAVQVDAGYPWKQVSNWADRHLPPNTVVLCDRWFTPWNELSINPSTNAVYTFTIPNEPPNVYMESRWRETAIAFLRNHPFAAFFDQKQYWGRIGPWEEPHKLFSHKEEFVDVANNRLEHIGLAYRVPSSDTPEAWRSMTLYYNRPEDVLERSRREGARVVVGFGPEWAYLKPWRPPPGWSEQLMQTLWIQAGAFSARGKGFSTLAEINQFPQAELMNYLNAGRWDDYRVAGEHTALRIYNLTGVDLPVELRLSGISLNGPIQMKIGATGLAFPATLLTTRTVPLKLHPGENTVPFSVAPGRFFLVKQVVCQAVL